MRCCIALPGERMAEIKAISTRYKGYHFRSRLEARWAVFFDAVGVDWDYEPEGFSTRAGHYLPDFVICRGSYVVEIKPNKEGSQFEPCFSDELGKAIDAAETIGASHAIVYYGPPWDCYYEMYASHGGAVGYGIATGWHSKTELNAAKSAAKSARFEHGESGAT